MQGLLTPGLNWQLPHNIVFGTLVFVVNCECKGMNHSACLVSGDLANMFPIHSSICS